MPPHVYNRPDRAAAMAWAQPTANDATGSGTSTRSKRTTCFLTTARGPRPRAPDRASPQPCTPPPSSSARLIASPAAAATTTTSPTLPSTTRAGAGPDRRPRIPHWPRLPAPQA